MRQIDADALIAEIEKRRKAAKTLTGIDMVMLLKDAPTVNGWISVKDRLPDKSGTYLCCQPKAASICALNTVRWSEVKGWIGKEVGSRIEGIEYWMPLPEPPNEG